MNVQGRGLDNPITVEEIAAWLGCSVEETGRRLALAMHRAGVTAEMLEAAAGGMAVMPTIRLEDLRDMAE